MVILIELLTLTQKYATLTQNKTTFVKPKSSFKNYEK